MHSAIYKGHLRHRRFMPYENRFSYRVFMMYLDLDELDEVLALSRWWSRLPWRPARFERSDFLGDASVPLDQAVRDEIYRQTGEKHHGPIRLLANPRYYGYNINPISCYYCFDQTNQLQFIVSEVVNTPWQERQAYVLRCRENERFHRFSFAKQMHVSPFNPMHMTYHWCSNIPGKHLSLNIDTECADEIHLDATMALKRHEITASSLAGVLIEHPWMTAKVALTIYWQALKIWCKKNPFYNHPGPRSQDQKNQSTINGIKLKT